MVCFLTGIQSKSYSHFNFDVGERVVEKMASSRRRSRKKWVRFRVLRLLFGYIMQNCLIYKTLQPSQQAPPGSQDTRDAPRRIDFRIAIVIFLIRAKFVLVIELNSIDYLISGIKTNDLINYLCDVGYEYSQYLFRTSIFGIYFIPFSNEFHNLWNHNRIIIETITSCVLVLHILRTRL